MIQVLPNKDNRESFGSVMGRNLGEGFGPSFGQQFQQTQQNLQKKKELDKLLGQENMQLYHTLGVDLRGITDPKQRQEIVSQKLQQGTKAVKAGEELASNKAILKDLEERRGLEPGSLDAYINDPKMGEQATRPAKEPKKTQASQPIDPEQLKIIKDVRKNPEFENASLPKKYQMLTDAGASKENAQAETDIYAKEKEITGTEFERNYKSNESFIEEATNRFKAYETEMKPKLMQMQKIATDDELIGPTGAAFLETLGIPYGALEDPSSELYNKLSLDLLKGLPETYGNKILKVEVDNFLKTIPSLLNSPDGRRMIASNILKLGEMKEVYYEAMRKAQKEALDNGKFPKDFQQQVFDQVRPQINRINDEFVKLSEIKSVPKGTIPFFNPSGEVEFIPKEDEQWAIDHGGKRIW